MPRSHSAWRTGPAAPLVLVLLSMLALSGFLAYQAWDAARSQRRVAEAALRDYAGFASAELRRRVESRANTVLNAALMPARVPVMRLRGEPLTPPGFEMADFVASVEVALGGCGCVGALSDYFAVDLETGEVLVWRQTLGAAHEDWLAGVFAERVRSSPVQPAPAAAIRTERLPNGLVIVQRVLPEQNLSLAPPSIALDSTRVLVYAAASHGDVQRAFGFAVDVPAFVAPLVEAAFSGDALLPLSLIGSANNEQALSALVWTAAGDTVFRAGDGSVAGAEVVDTLRLATGAVVARLAVRPEMAGQLVIGGLPRSRIPVLLGSLALTLTLLLVAISQLRRQLELFRLRADFVSGVSHELRTPLAQIRLFSDLLASDRLEDAQRRRSLRILTEEAQRLTYLVENVLRFSRSERRMERVAPVRLELAPWLREVVDDFAPLARSRGAAIELDAPGGLHAVLDPDAMRQVLLNVLDNAVKYGPRDQRIVVRAHGDDARLTIEVDDEGPGIPPVERERIWEPYRRLGREVEVATGGSGIGLAVVRELVALHGGRTFVADAPGGGCRLVVELPGAAGAQPGAPPESRVEGTRTAAV